MRLHVGQYLLHQELVGAMGVAGAVGAVGAIGAVGGTARHVAYYGQRIAIEYRSHH